MKILILSNLLTTGGGVEVCLQLQAKLLEENGHEVFFFATDKKPYTIKENKYSEFFPKFIPFNTMNKFNFFLNLPTFFYNRESYKKLDKYLKKIKPDVVHCHSIYAYLTPSVLDACKKNNVPVVMTIHDTKAICPAGQMMFKGQGYCKNELCVNTKKINVFPCVLNKCHNNNFINSFVMAIEHLTNKITNLAKKIDYFVFPSNVLLNMAAKIGVDKNQLVLINNFIEDEMYKNKPNYDNNDYFLYVGRLSKEKGANYLLDAMNLLANDVKLKIIGTGPEFENLLEQKKQLKLDNVELLGFIDREKLPDYYKNCIATILPCNWFENFPTSILESYTFGKPVIASRIGGIPEMIDDNDTGILFEAGNVQQLADAVLRLNSDRSQAMKMGQTARSKAENLYTSKTYYDKLMELYGLAQKKDKKS